MTLKRRTLFYSLLAVMLLAAVYSPSSLSFGAQSTPLTDSTGFGLSDFVSLLHSTGHSVVIANSSDELISSIGPRGTTLVVLDPDQALSPTEQSAISQGYDNGSLSLLISEGNTTNNAFLSSQFQAKVTGSLISDAGSSIFSVQLNLGHAPVSGTLDFSSPLVAFGGTLRPVAYSPATSTDGQNSTEGPRVVAATAQSSSGSRALIITDHNPFTNRFLSPQDQSLNDTAFVEAMVTWVAAPGGNGPVVVDNAQYVSSTPSLHFGIPVGVLALGALQLAVGSFVGATGAGVGSGGFFGGLLGLVGLSWIAVVINLLIALLVMRFIRNRLRGVYAEDKVVKDDQPLPQVELAVPAQSRERESFLTVSRKKSFYVATCAQLYEVIDDLTKMELGEGLGTITPEKLSARTGQGVEVTAKFLGELKKVYAYAISERRLLFPPVLSWKRKTEKLTSQAEAFLNALGMSMKGEGGAKQVEYAIRR